MLHCISARCGRADAADQRWDGTTIGRIVLAGYRFAAARQGWIVRRVGVSMSTSNSATGHGNQIMTLGLQYLPTS